KQSDHRPHLIIGYKMYNDSLSFNGYNQPDIEEWVKSQKEDLDYDRQKYTLKTGTLLIQFFDRRQNRSIWQGYATTLYGNIDFGNQRHLKNAVISILLFQVRVLAGQPNPRFGGAGCFPPNLCEGGFCFK